MLPHRNRHSRKARRWRQAWESSRGRPAGWGRQSWKAGRRWETRWGWCAKRPSRWGRATNPTLLLGSLSVLLAAATRIFTAAVPPVPPVAVTVTVTVTVASTVAVTITASVPVPVPVTVAVTVAVVAPSIPLAVSIFSV